MNPISAFLKMVLDFIVDIVGNYGWSVIIFTLLIRLVLMPLDLKSKRSMKKTQLLQPKIAELQKKYGKDREKLVQKQQELFKKEGASPLSGCLPMLLTLPVMWLMFNAMRDVANEHTMQMLLDLKNGVQVSLQNWFWIKNVFQADSFMATVVPAVGDPLQFLATIDGSSILTAENIEAVRTFVTTAEYQAIAAQYGADTLRYSTTLFGIWQLTIPMQFNGWFILPVLSAASSYLSTKLLSAGQQTPVSNDPNNQAMQTSKMMGWMMPIISLWICSTQSAAFSIYWVAANIIQIAQQYLINIYLERKEASKPEEVIQP